MKNISHFTLLTAIEPLEWVNSNFYVDAALDPMMEPFEESTENPKYLEFQPQDERDSYETDTETLVQLPNGLLASPYSSPFFGKFVVEDAVVYQRRFGKLKRKKRSKAAKKMKVLEIPVKQRYKTYDDYMRHYHLYKFDNDQQAYGYYSNPNAQWDWYQIGGRWPFMFLVREDCPSKVFGERSWGWDDKEYAEAQEGPEGYIWVAGAQKSDIAWELMKELRIKDLTETFRVYEAWWKTGVRPEGLHPFNVLTDDGIKNWTELAYAKDETLEQYLERKGCGPDSKYAYTTYAYLNDGQWFAKGDMGWWGISANDKEPVMWHNMVDQFINDVPDDYLLVSVDCHI